LKRMELLELIAIVCVIITLPLIADLVDNLFPTSGFGRLAQNTVGYLMIVLILFLVLVSVYLWWIVYLPFKQLEGTDYLESFLHTSFMTFLLFNGLIHYTRAIGENPGFVPRNKKIDQKYKICELCKTHKDIRTHHCKICNRCVYRMDHHCPFIAGCVGKGNHRHFFLFLLYLWFGVVYAAYISFGPFKRCYIDHEIDFKSCILVGKYSLCFPCVMLIFVPVSAMLIWQLYIGWTGITTVEILIQMRKSKMKSWLNNWICDLLEGNISNFKHLLGDDMLASLFVAWNYVKMPKTTPPKKME